MDVIELSKYPVYQEMKIDMAVLASSMEVETVIDHVMNQMLIRLRASVLAEEKESGNVVITYKTPTVPKFLTDMFPSLKELPLEIQTRTESIPVKRKILYPEANIRIPELGNGRVRVVVEEEEDAKPYTAFLYHS